MILLILKYKQAHIYVCKFTEVLEAFKLFSEKMNTGR